MIIDVYKDFKENPAYTKLVGRDYLFMEYKCPIDVEKFQLLTEMHLIIHVLSGKKDWITSDRTIGIKSGDALFIRKGVYTTRQYFDEDYCVLLFFISDDFIRNFMIENLPEQSRRQVETIGEQAFKLDVDEGLNTLFFSMFNYLKMGDKIPRKLVELKFRELIFNLILNPAHQRLAEFFNDLVHSNKTHIEDVMMKNFQYDLQMEEFARLCGRSLSTFKRDFKKFYRQSPGRWLMDKRLELAKGLLTGSDLNVNEICYECGFRNTSHFNKAFKEKYEYPPRQFREKLSNV